MNIAKLRKRIDALDGRLVKLLNERTQVAGEIGKVKRRLGDRLNILCCDYPKYSIVLPTLAVGGNGTANIGGNIIPEEMARLSRPWTSFEQIAHGTFYQSYLWCSAWLETVGRASQVEPVVVILRDGRYGHGAGECTGRRGTPGPPEHGETDRLEVDPRLRHPRLEHGQDDAERNAGG
ncbi:MAG: hypothetical protein HGA82_02970, partial [Anaerolineales bacterium]|nr:hypothetical protein [Anaerolineales bacterium]